MRSKWQHQLGRTPRPASQLLDTPPWVYCCYSPPCSPTRGVGAASIKQGVWGDFDQPSPTPGTARSPGGVHSLPVPSPHALLAPQSPARRLQDLPPQGVPGEGPTRHHCTLPKPGCSMPSQGSQSALPAQPHSGAGDPWACPSPGAAQGRALFWLPAQEQGAGPQYCWLRTRCREDAQQQAQARSLGGCLGLPFSSVTCNTVGGPGQASASPPSLSLSILLLPSTILCCPLWMPVTSLQSHQHPSLRGHPEMRCQTPLSWRARAKSTSGLEGDRQTS